MSLQSIFYSMKNIILILIPFIFFSCDKGKDSKSEDAAVEVKSNQLYHGVDIHGKERACRQMREDMACTEIFTPDDQFAINCKNRGDTPIQCGCHDYICIIKK